jgi:hypothetical protein
VPIATMALNTSIDVIAEVRVASEGSGSLRASFDTARARNMGPNFKVLSAIGVDLSRKRPAPHWDLRAPVFTANR